MQKSDDQDEINVHKLNFLKFYANLVLASLRFGVGCHLDYMISDFHELLKSWTQKILSFKFGIDSKIF